MERSKAVEYFNQLNSQNGANIALEFLCEYSRHKNKSEEEINMLIQALTKTLLVGTLPAMCNEALSNLAREFTIIIVLDKNKKFLKAF